jgi:hypothetical protein
MCIIASEKGRKIKPHLPGIGTVYCSIDFPYIKNIDDCHFASFCKIGSCSAYFLQQSIKMAEKLKDASTFIFNRI